MQLQLDNLSAAYLLEQIRPLLEGAFVNNVSQTDNGWLKIKLHSKSGSRDLIIAKNIFFISNYSIQARHGKTNFAVSLKKELYNKRIVSVQLHEFDRVAEIKLLEHTLILELLGEGNQILINKDGIIISCAKIEEWSDRKTKKGEKYIFPKHSLNPSVLSAQELFGIFSASEKDAIRAIISKVNMPPVIAEEAFFRLGLDKSKKATEISSSETEKICAKIRELYSVSQEKYLPVAYKEFVFPFSLTCLKEEPAALKSLNDCLNELLVHSISTPLEQEKKSVSKGRVSGLEFMQGQQVLARKKFESQSAENLKKAELIYRHYSEIEELSKAVNAGAKKGLTEKQILQAIESEAKKGNAAAKMLKKLDLKNKKMELEL